MMSVLIDYFPSGMTHYWVGGLMIGLAVSLLYLSNGVMAGMSTVYSSTLSYFSQRPFFQRREFTSTRMWRLVYALGLIVGGLIWVVLAEPKVMVTELPAWQLALGGFVGGFGARLSNGCTSGHGICGIASLSLDSLLAVLTFLSVAIITAQCFSVMGGWL